MSLVSIIYMLLTVIILVMIVKKKEITVAGIVAILLIGLIHTKNPASAVIVLCSAITAGLSDILPVYIGISLIIAMTAALKKTGTDKYISVFLRSMPKNRSIAYFVIGIFMMIISFMIWPSPAVALLGALVLPAAIRAGLPPLYAASAMSLFGYGVALSGDFLIQGVPSIAAKSAGFSSSDLMPYLIPLWAVMSVTTILASYIQIRLELKKNGTQTMKSAGRKLFIPSCDRKKRKIILIVTIVLFLAAILAMILMDIKGDDATALIAGTALICTCAAGFIAYPRKEAAEQILGFMEEGFCSAMKVFAPAVVVIGFFSMGNTEISTQVLGEDAPGCITEIVGALMQTIHVPQLLLPVLLVIIGFIYSIDGSGFAGLMVIGAVAGSLTADPESVKLLTALGQIVIIWVGGGTLIPWSMVPVSSVSGVSTYELAKKNLIPVCIGFLATAIAAAVMMYTNT